MFLGACSGCIEMPTPLYYWNPYVAHAYSKSSLQIANILQLSESTETAEKRLRTEVSHHRRFASINEQTSSKIKPSEIRHLARRNEGARLNNILDYSRKKSDKCTLPSALEPLQALCSEGPRGLRSSSPTLSTSRGSRSPSSPHRPQLKFGISKILSDDFGKDKSEKERPCTPENSTCHVQRRECECTYDRCHVYRDHIRYTPHALSAVHALQPPKYPTSPHGTDVLPGPYSVLNTEVSLGSQSKRKRSWSRAVFSNLQRKGLEKRFEVQKYVTKPDRRQLAAMLGLTDAQVKVWFQNRRMKWRHAQQVNASEEMDSSPEDDKKTHVYTEQTTENKVLNSENNNAETDAEDVSVEDSSSSSMDSL